MNGTVAATNGQTISIPPAVNGVNPHSAGRKSTLIREPLKLNEFLNEYASFDVTPLVGTEFPQARLAEWMSAPNSDDLLRDLAITSK